MGTRIDHGSRSATGVRHQTNEDAIGVDRNLGVWLVADGMGGHAAGDLASSLVRDTMLEQLAAGQPLAAAIDTAHRAVLDAAKEDADRAGMGSTVAALKLDGDRAEIMWVGDSRVYLFRHGELARLTRDHSYVEYLIKQGQIRPDEAENHPQRNVLTQTLGFEQPVPDTVSWDLEAEDWLLICTDGLTVAVGDAEISDILADAASPQQAADALVSAVVERKGQDDASAVVLHYGARRSLAWGPIATGVVAGVLAFLLALWVKSS